MRIWIQSGTPLGTSPLYKPYFDSLQRHAARVARPGTQVDFPNLGKNLPGAARTRTHLHFVTQETIKGALRAQEEGYDAFVTNCLDLAWHELREMVRIPVVFMAQATIAFYSQLAPNFAFLVNSQRLHQYFGSEIADRYALRGRMAPGGWVSFAFTDYANLWGQPQPFVEQFQQVARGLVAQGATSFFPAGLYLSQWLIDQGIREVDGAILMDPLAIAIRTAEAMVELQRLGVQPYRGGTWAPPAEELRQMLAREFQHPTPN